MLKKLMSRCVKTEVLREATTSFKLLQVKVESAKTHKRSCELDVGIAARSFLVKSGASEAEKANFFNECKSFLVSMTSKIIGIAPVNFAIVRAMSCFDPYLLSSNEMCENHMDTLLQILHDNNILPALSAAKQQFLEFSKKVAKEWKQDFSNYSYKKSPLGVFFFHKYLNVKDFKDLWTVVKIVMTLSHGNASSESGFSINKDILVENMQEKSLVAFRCIYDAVKSQGGPLSVKITPEMFQHVKMSCSQYHMALEEKKMHDEKHEKANKERKRTLAQIQVLQQKRAWLANDIHLEEQKIEAEINELKRKN
ncbi:hypothetical protein AVEN_262601-1 [Araneus ventricosus]|uniref:Uncharacterized protein n=1 Tax=Araneus ventricosus TaxID=182803 RepID=A0A4Y2HJA4_ARAVE|nr:hypothetical protein AVEN_262601-1 [Araneus ventricosus]